MTTTIKALETEIARLGGVVSAAENWAPQYGKDPNGHAKIIKLEGSIEYHVRGYLRALATERVVHYVDWMRYNGEVIKAYDVNVIIQDEAIDNEQGFLLTALHDPLLTGMAIGAQAGEVIYGTPLGITATDTTLMEAARKYSAELVTKINETTRDKIKQSISTSLQLHEQQADAVSRLQKVIRDPKRAATIARTEAVNSYTQGLLNFGQQSTAVAKEWQALDAIDECGALDGQKVAIDDSFPGEGGDGPPLHPNCRCGLRLIYSNEDWSDANAN